MKIKILVPALLLPVMLVLCAGSLSAQTANQFFNQAVEASRAKNYKEAERLFGECIRVAPTDWECYYRRGLVREIAIGYGLALEDYNSALNLNPNSHVLFTARGSLYNSLKRFDEGIADLTRALQIKPDHARAYYYRANIQRDKGDLDKAIADYTQAIRYDPKDDLSYSFRARVYERKNLPDNAVADYNSAIAVNPSKGSNYYYRGRIRYDAGKIEEAETDFKRAIELDASLKAQIDATRTLAAVKQLQANLEAKPKTPVEQAHSDGYKQLDAKQWDAAIASFTIAIELAPKDHWGYVYRGRAHKGKGDYAKAIADLNAGIALLKPAQTASFINERAGVHYDRGNYALALADVNKSIAANAGGQPDHWNLLLRGKIYAKQGKTTLARADFQKAMQMNQYVKSQAEAELAKLPAI